MTVMPFNRHLGEDITTALGSKSRNRKLLMNRLGDIL